MFNGDLRALNAARAKINEEYKKNKHVTEQDSIRAVSICRILTIIYISTKLFLSLFIMPMIM